MDDTAVKRAAGVWAVWIALTASLCTLVLALGSSVPFWDDWEYVPALTGSAPVTPGWLWALHNEHRLPLSRLLFLASFHLGGNDLRGTMLLNVALLSAAAAVLIAAARRARGSSSWTDAALPLLLLHPGHEDNVIWAFEILLVLPVFLMWVAVATLASVEDTLGRRQALVIGCAAILMPLGSATGFLLAPAFALWLLWRAVAGRDDERRALSATPRLLVVLGVLGLASWASYLIDYHANPGHPKPAGLAEVARATAELLSIAFGPAQATHGWLGVLVVAALVLGTAGALARWWWRSPEERLRAEALLAAFAAVTGLVLLLGWGRSSFPLGAARAARYVTLATAVVGWAYMAWCRIPAPRTARIVQAGILVLCLALFPRNLAFGLAAAEERHEQLQALARDVDAGLPLDAIAARHAAAVYPSSTQLADRLGMLRERRLGPFAHADAEANYRRLYPFLRAPLIRLESTGRTVPHEGSVFHRPVLIVPSDGEAVFDIRPGTRRVQGAFGTLTGPRPPAEDADHPSGGTYFQIVFRPDVGPDVSLLAAHLRAGQPTGSRQSFDLALPGGGGRLILTTRSAPAGMPPNEFGDWGYWANVELR